MRKQRKKRRTMFFGRRAVVGVLGMWLWLYPGNLTAQLSDISLLRDINLHRNRSLDAPFRTLSHSMVPVGVGVPVLMTGIGLLKKDSTLTRNGLQTGFSLLLATAVTFGTKYAVKRPRPYETYPDLENLSVENDPSFPSGHASAAFSTATSLALVYKKWYVVVPAYLWAGGVAYSRLHLGVHYPSDVLAGALIGSGSAFLSHKAQRWLARKYRK